MRKKVMEIILLVPVIRVYNRVESSGSESFFCLSAGHDVFSKDFSEVGRGRQLGSTKT